MVFRRIFALAGIGSCASVFLLGGACPGIKAPWNIEEVGTGLHPSLALDPSSGLPRISYYDGNHIAYAQRDGTGWSTEVVDEASDALGGSSLALDASTGYPRIAYFTWTAAEGAHLRYAEWTGTGWDIVVVQSNGSAGDVGGYCSLRLDPTSGEPRIAYVDYDSMEVRYAERIGGDWVRRTVADCSGSTGVSLAVKSTGAPRISYRGGCHLRYAGRNLGVWTIENAAMLGNCGYDSSLALDPATERPRIAHYYITGMDTHGLVYTFKDTLGWHHEYPDPEGVYRGCSLALDPSSGYARISCYEETRNELRFISWDGVAWNMEVVENTEGISLADMVSSLALDPATGSPRIAYAATDLPRPNLRYAWRD